MNPTADQGKVKTCRSQTEMRRMAMTSTTDVTKSHCPHIVQIRVSDARICRNPRVVDCNDASTAGRSSYMRGILDTRYEKLQ